VPLEGVESLTLEHGGATYRFASEANRAAFREHPARYEPAYGGWCAYAMADGDKVEVDEESFLVQGERLYLFYDGLFNDTRSKWSKKPREMQADADVEWERITGEDPARERAPEVPRDASKLALGKRGLALEGFDPVSYFDGGAKKGSEALRAVYRGAVYRFASDENRAKFRANPARYEPAYGGWCAFAMAADKQVEPDPEAFLVEGGALLVFYRKGKKDTRDEWKADAAGLRSRADAAWARFLADKK
jgi:YHS domain-containing protein